MQGEHQHPRAKAKKKLASVALKSLTEVPRSAAISGTAAG